MTTFQSLGLEPELLRAVAARGYQTPTPIQAQAIPAVLADRDVLAGAQTGTGKTAGFVLPILQKLGHDRGQVPRVLILVPTRELAAQVAENVQAYGAHKALRSLCIFGGVGERPQIDGLRAGCDILIATPGRLLDLCEQKYCDLRGIRCLVLDEADRMLDMGFIHAIKRIVKLLPQQRQTLLFSATYNDEIRSLAAGMLRDPVHIEVAARNSTAEKVAQIAFRVPKEHKRHLLVHLFEHGATPEEGPWQQVLVFCRTKHGANRLAQQLEAAGVTAAAIHGNKSQAARTRALAEFKSGQLRALVATEVASRGLDIKELPHVVNFELPNVPEDYVHRIGRTARAGSTGSAVSLVSPDEAGLLRDIEKTMRQSVPFVATPTFEMPEGPPPRAASAAAAGRASHASYPEARSGQPASSQAARARHGQPGGRSQQGQHPQRAQQAPSRHHGQRTASGAHRGSSGHTRGRGR